MPVRVDYEHQQIVVRCGVKTRVKFEWKMMEKNLF